MEIELSWLWLGVAMVLGGLLGGLAWWLRPVAPAHIAVSDLSRVATSKSLKAKLAFLPNWLKGASLAFFLVALPGIKIGWHAPNLPHHDTQRVSDLSPVEEEIPMPSEGVALYLLLDQSSSMIREMTLDGGKGRRAIRRIDALRLVTRKFIAGDPLKQMQGRSDDLIGLIGFARVAHVMCPLTLDHRSLLESLEKFSAVKGPQEDGTAIGYALFKTVNMIAATRYFGQELIQQGRPSYDIKSSAIVLVTDGMQNPNPLDAGHELRQMGLLDAAKYAKEKEVRVYIVNVEPMLRYPQYQAVAEEQKVAAELTGGKFFIGDDPETLTQIYAHIDQLERVALPGERLVMAKVHEKRLPQSRCNRWLALAPYLIGAGLSVFLLGSLLEMTYLRRVT